MPIPFSTTFGTLPCSPTVSGCTFRNNSTYRSGGGIYVAGYASPTITDCVFENNKAIGNITTYGGGITNYSGPTTKITSCVFRGNRASFGGGVYSFYSSPQMANCTFDGNSAAKLGGALSSQSKTQVVTNCNFYGNQADSFASVIYNSSSALTTLTNCIVWNNGGSADYQIYGGGAVINYSDIDILVGYTGTDNIHLDPKFNPADGDFHLETGSPCIDTGDNAAPFLPAYDFEGDPRIFPVVGGTVDRGVDEVTNQPPDVSQAYASPDCIWPANHKMVDVSILGVTDPDENPVTVTITGVTSDEPTASDKGSGGAKHAPDADGIGTDTASLRAERSGRGDGRVYVVSFNADDGNGGVSAGSVEVRVPRDRSEEGCVAVDSGQDYDATEIN